MKPLQEIKTIVDAATDALLKQNRRRSAGRISVDDKIYSIMCTKAVAYDNIAEILEKEEADWWN